MIASKIPKCTKCLNNGHESIDCLIKPNEIIIKNPLKIPLCKFCNSSNHYICPLSDDFLVLQFSQFSPCFGRTGVPWKSADKHSCRNPPAGIHAGTRRKHSCRNPPISIFAGTRRQAFTQEGRCPAFLQRLCLW